MQLRHIAFRFRVGQPVSKFLNARIPVFRHSRAGVRRHTILLIYLTTWISENCGLLALNAGRYRDEKLRIPGKRIRKLP